MRNPIAASEPPSGDKRKLDTCLDELPVSYFQYRLLFICGLVFMSDAMEITLLGFLSACAGHTFNLSTTARASISSAVFIGELLGSFFWGPFADRVGRRTAYTASSFVMATGGLLSGLAPDYWSLLIFRAICGFGVGGSTVAFDLLAEFVPTQARGNFLMAINYSWTAGGMFVVGMAWAVLSSPSGWRELAYLTAAPILLACVAGVFFLPESPRWLLTQGRKEEAVQVILDAARVNGVEMEPFVLEDDAEEAESARKRDAAPWYEAYGELFSPELRGVTTSMLVVFGCYVVVYYGVVLFVTREFDTSSGDGDSCSFNYPPIFENASAELIGIFVSFFVINRGRVLSQSLFYFLGGVATVTMGSVGYDATAVVVASNIARVFVMGASCCTWVAAPEVYPTHLRATGHALCFTVSRIAAVFVPFLIMSPLSNSAIGAILFMFNLLAAVASLTLPESAGKTLEECASYSSKFNTKSIADKMLMNISFITGGLSQKDEEKLVDSLNILSDSVADDL